MTNTTCICRGVYTKPELSKKPKNSPEIYWRKKMQHEKYSLISEPQDLIKNNDRVLTFPQFQNQQVIVMITALKQQVTISNNDLLFHLNDLFKKFI